MLKRENLRPFLKASTGIGRGHGKRKKSGNVVAKSSSADENKDIVFTTRTETDEEYRKRRGHGFKHKVSTEALKAIAELQNGAEFTVEYAGFGSYGETRYVINKSDNGSRWRRVSRVNENGGHDRSKSAKTNSQLRDAIRLDIADRIIIHNGGKSLIKPKTKQEEEAEWAEIVRNMEAYEARRAAKAVRQSARK